MDSNQKKFGIYVFLSTFSRNLIEVFIPVILYKFGYNLKEVILYYLFVNLFSLILSYPFIKISKKFNNKILATIGVIFFALLQLMLNYMYYSIIYLIILALMFAIYRRGYWISRRFYNLKIIKKDKISTTYSLISIFNQFAIIISSYIGSLFLDFISVKILTIIAIILFFLSIIPLYTLKFEHERNNIKLEFIKTIKEIPIKDIYIFGVYELLNVIKFLIPVYLFIYIKNNYQIIGINNLITNLAIVLFIYLYGKLIDGKKNYLKLSIILVVITYILKINFTSYLLIIISFIEGIVTKMYELSISKEFYLLSKKFEYNNYNLVYEIVQNTFRLIIVLILFVFFDNIKIMIYVTLFFMIISSLFTFKKINKLNFKS